MKLRNLSRWELNGETQGLLFFAQRVDELLFDFSLDTYKPPALNAPHLCREALEIIDEINKGFIDSNNLVPVLEELVWSVQNDNVAKALLDTGVEYYTLHNDQTPLSITRLRLEILNRAINSNRYINELCRELRLAIKGGKKRAIDFLATSLITCLINGRVSKQWLYEQTHEYFFSPYGATIGTADQIDGYLEAVNQKWHDYSVVCVVSDLVTKVRDSLKAFRITLLDEPPEWMADMLAVKPLMLGEVLVQVESISARDPYSAREAALRTLDNLSDLFTLFYHRKRIEWRAGVFVKWECCARNAVECHASKGPMEKAFDLGEVRAAKELSSMLKRFAARRDRDSFLRFNRVVDLHGICVAHDIPENQLVNLWTALETLVPSRVGETKIRQVVDGVIPFIGIDYFRRIFERLLSDLLTWDKWRTAKLLNKVPLSHGVQFLQRLAVLIVSPEYSGLRDELYNKLGDFHLLRFRCFSLSKELGTSKDAIARLERHERKVRWQLRRLYRSRNLIVHTSRSPSYIETLIENGHDYLDSVLFEVIRRSCSDYQTSTIEQVFELTSVSYKALKVEMQAVTLFEGELGTILVRRAGAEAKMGSGSEVSPQIPALNQ